MVQMAVGPFSKSKQSNQLTYRVEVPDRTSTHQIQRLGCQSQNRKFMCGQHIAKDVLYKTV